MLEGLNDDQKVMGCYLEVLLFSESISRYVSSVVTIRNGIGVGYSRIDERVSRGNFRILLHHALVVHRGGR